MQGMHYRGSASRRGVSLSPSGNCLSRRMPVIKPPPRTPHYGSSGDALASLTDDGLRSACVRRHEGPCTSEPSHLALMRTELQSRLRGDVLDRLGLALITVIEPDLAISLGIRAGAAPHASLPARDLETALNLRTLPQASRGTFPTRRSGSLAFI